MTLAESIVEQFQIYERTFHRKARYLIVSRETFLELNGELRREVVSTQALDVKTFHSMAVIEMKFQFGGKARWALGE